MFEKHRALAVVWFLTTIAVTGLHWGLSPWMHGGRYLVLSLGFGAGLASIMAAMNAYTNRHR
jgi:hypothetical protein